MAARRTRHPAVGVSFADRFRALAREHQEEICRAIVDKAAEGERWAAELVLKYAVDREPGVGPDGAPDRFALLLEEIRARLAEDS